MRRGAPPWALVAVLLLLVSSCAGADQPAPDNAAVSARYENQARADAAPEAPARPEASAPARVQPAPAAATPAPATNRVVETPKPAPAATPSQADSSASRSPEAPRAAPQSPPPLSSPTPPPLDTTLPPPDPNSGAPLTLSDCVRLAAERSPYLKGPALEVEIRKLDEKDAWYKLFPNLNFLLTSDRFVSGQETKYRKKGDTYNSLGLSSGSYNPIAAWVQHDAQKDVTRLARMGQTLALQELILQLANAFVALDNLDRQIAVRREMIDLAEKGLVYATRLENVQTSQIDIKIARQRLSMAHAEYEYLLAARTQAVLGLKDLIGLPAYERVTLDVGQFRDQELPRYKADGYDLAFAKRLDPDFASFNLAVPRMGTPLRREALDRGYADPESREMDQSGSRASLATESLAAERAEALRNRASREFYLRPAKILGRLLDVRTTVDALNLTRDGLGVMADAARGLWRERKGSGR